MKKTLALLTALALAFALAACGSKEEPSPYAGAEMGDTLQLGGIDWYVIRVEDGRALLLSVDILEKKPYHHERADLTWEISDMRAYLNGEFFDATFSDEEKAWIAETELKNETPENFETDCGNDTLDKVFLLNMWEVENYFTDNAARKAIDPETGDSVSWWLRDPGRLSSKAASYVWVSGGPSDGGLSVTSETVGVRPALWLIV